MATCHFSQFYVRDCYISFFTNVWPLIDGFYGKTIAAVGLEPASMKVLVRIIEKNKVCFSSIFFLLK